MIFRKFQDQYGHDVAVRIDSIVMVENGPSDEKGETSVITLMKGGVCVRGSMQDTMQAIFDALQAAQQHSRKQPQIVVPAARGARGPN